MTEGAHILVVDDEPDVRATIRDYLQIHGFRVSTAEGGTAMRRLLERHRVDVVLLDVRMPGENGFALARALRSEASAGIIMVTASGETVDRVIGLESGADDYVAKPVDLRELLARVRALLRRRRDRAAPLSATPASGPVQFGRFRFDPATAALTGPDGAPVRLLESEAALLAAFARNPNRVLTREELLEMAQGRALEPFDRSIDMRISRLRRKIEVDPARPAVLTTVRGAGYLFVPGGED